MNTTTSFKMELLQILNAEIFYNLTSAESLTREVDDSIRDFLVNQGAGLFFTMPNAALSTHYSEEEMVLVNQMCALYLDKIFTLQEMEKAGMEEGADADLSS